MVTVLLAGHTAKREESCAQDVGRNGLSDCLPVSMSGIAEINEVEHLLPRERTAQIVVGVVPVLLEINKRLSDPHDFLRNLRPSKRSLELAPALFDDLPARLVHRCVNEGAAEATPKRFSVRGASDPAVDCRFRQQMEQ